MPSTLQKIRECYANFAIWEAKPVLPTYERLAQEVCASDRLLEFLATLHEEKQQPNLLFAAQRYLRVVPEPGALEAAVLDHADEIRAVMLSRRTQTNEPARCASILPFLAEIDAPLAIIEVDAAAGLCLHPDRYSYRYETDLGTRHLQASDEASTFTCRVEGDLSVPSALPEIVWRAGIDLNPLDPCSEEDAVWLRTLVWPEHHERRVHLDRALSLAAASPPVDIVQGDLMQSIDALLASVPSNAVPVVFHTAVLCYIPSVELRDAFARKMIEDRAVWISNEAPKVFSATREIAQPDAGRMHFVVCVDGTPRAFAALYGDRLLAFPPT